MTVTNKNTVIIERAIFSNEFISKKYIGTDYSYKHEIVWKNAVGFLILHLIALYGIYELLFGNNYKGATFFWNYLIGYISGLGVSIGAHRYYTHKSFKAKLPLQVLMLSLHTVAGENSMFEWVRDHRLHHRYSDTDADPHNAKRGFFFSHIGWLMCKKHPYVIELGRKIDMSDLIADPMVMFQKKYYIYLYFGTAMLFPIVVPVYFWGETWWTAILFSLARYALNLNITWTVNSAAHLYGTRPYDKNIQSVESWYVSLITVGEGWHNYHHAFPWDYKAAEMDMHLNLAASIIRFFAAIGQAYDLKTVSQEMVDKRIMNTGDGTHYRLGDEESKASVTAWGPLHPFNPTYTTTMKAPDATLEPRGLPLFHENDFQVFGDTKK